MPLNIAEKTDLAVVVSCSFLVLPHILDLFPSGAMNLHPSRLPKYRGAAPIQHAIWSNDQAFFLFDIAVLLLATTTFALNSQVLMRTIVGVKRVKLYLSALRAPKTTTTVLPPGRFELVLEPEPHLRVHCADGQTIGVTRVKPLSRKEQGARDFRQWPWRAKNDKN